MSGNVISVKTLREKNFHSLEFTGQWYDWLGNPERNFKAIIYGPSGSGKSTFALKFVAYLAESFGKVLYNSHEEGFSQTLQDRIIENDIKAKNLFFADRMSYDDMCEKVKRGYYKFAVIDSLQYMGFKYSEYKNFKDRFPRKGLIVISQTNNRGTIKGGTDIIHACDIKIKIHHGRAEIISRFAKGTQTVTLFKPKSSQPTLFS